MNMPLSNVIAILVNTSKIADNAFVVYVYIVLFVVSFTKVGGLGTECHVRFDV